MPQRQRLRNELICILNLKAIVELISERKIPDFFQKVRDLTDRFLEDVLKVLLLVAKS